MVNRGRFWLFFIGIIFLTVGSFSITRKSSDASIHIYSRIVDQGIVISQNGNVGINTLSATEALTVSGNGRFSGTIAAKSFVGDGVGLTNLPTVSSANLALTSNIAISMNTQGLMGAISVATGNTIMSITTAGNVGIGTTSPLAPLHVVGGTGSFQQVDTLTMQAYSWGVGAESRLNFMMWGGGANGAGYGAGFAGVDIGNYDFRLDFRARNNTTTNLNPTTVADTKMVLMPDGQIGIGTTAPGSKLTVSGGGLAVGTSYATNVAGDGNVIIAGNVGIGTTVPSTKLEVAGTVSASAVVVNGTITANILAARLARRVVSIVSSATPAINSDATDLFIISALATNITSMTSGLTGTPVDGDLLEIRILDDGTARTITWGSSFASTTITLPTTTVISTTLRILLEWNAATSKWECVAVT